MVELRIVHWKAVSLVRLKEKYMLHFKVTAMIYLGSAMRLARKQRNLTQAQLAAMARLSRKTPGEIETGKVVDVASARWSAYSKSSV
jgi:DNA-binding XRE family transcriptional regulator